MPLAVGKRNMLSRGSNKSAVHTMLQVVALRSSVEQIHRPICGEGNVSYYVPNIILDHFNCIKLNCIIFSIALTTIQAYMM